MALADVIWKQLEPRFEKTIERAYVKGGEDMIRRFAFVYDAVAKTAKEDVYANAGAIPIEEVNEEFSQTVFEDIENENVESV